MKTTLKITALLIASYPLVSQGFLTTATIGNVLTTMIQTPALAFLTTGSFKRDATARLHNDTTNATMAPIVGDESFNFNILAYMSGAPYQGADIGEVLVAANNIKDGDFESFYEQFNSLATRVHNLAIAIDAKKHPVSARNAFFRSSTYYRAADVYLHGNWSDPRIMELWKKQATDFDKAIQLLPQPGERIEIHTDNFTIPAIFFKTNMPGRRPTVILGQGYDGAMEDLYHVMGEALLQRGMNAIVYEGPGQPTVRRYQDLGFMPGWERVVSPIVDYILTRDDVEADKIALMGYSFGGFLAPRAAAFEHRLAAVIAIDGVYDFGEAILQQFGPDAAKAVRSGKKEYVDRLGKQLQADPDSPTTLRWGINQGEWTFKTHSAYEFVKKAQDYTLEGYTEKIEAPVFVGEARSDVFFEGQAAKLAKELGKLATYHVFEDLLGAGEHCQIGASVLMNQVSLDWLEDVFCN
jgi:pimeloyl-ACP methyl ester carboxylesterase